MSLILDEFLFHGPSTSLVLAETAAARQGIRFLGEERDLFPPIIPFDWTSALCLYCLFKNKQEDRTRSFKGCCGAVQVWWGREHQEVGGGCRTEGPVPQQQRKSMQSLGKGVGGGDE